MKARELMIGDWVLISTYPEKVKLIGETLIKVWNRDNSIYVDDVSPIPLTAEILEKNGWEKEDVFGSLIRYRFFGPIDIETGGAMFRLSNNYFFCSGIHYVHELQHALRMCDIDKEITI